MKAGMESGPFTSALLLGPTTALRIEKWRWDLNPELQLPRQRSQPQQKEEGWKPRCLQALPLFASSEHWDIRGRGSADQDPCKDP